jgi:outer membrane immunogenic protein
MITRSMTVASAAFVLFVAAAASGQAQAQNYDGSGQLRFGAFAQGSQLDFDVQRPLAAAGTASIDGFGGGASFGYDWVLRDSLVLGLEADASVEDGDDTIHKGSLSDKRSLSLSHDYLVTLRGRLGAHLQPGWLVYATGGAALLGVEYQRPFVAGAPTVLDNDPATKISDTLTGWTVGGGTEIDLDGILLFAEYLHTGFDTWEFKDSVKGVSTQHEVDVDERLVRLGVKFKIGHDYYHDDVRRDRLK